MPDLSHHRNVYLRRVWPCGRLESYPTISHALSMSHLWTHLINPRCSFTHQTPKIKTNYFNVIIMTTTRIDQLNPTSRLNHLTHQTTWTESEITEFETLLGELFHLEFFSNLSKTLK